MRELFSFCFYCRHRICVLMWKVKNKSWLRVRPGASMQNSFHTTTKPQKTPPATETAAKQKRADGGVNQRRDNVMLQRCACAEGRAGRGGAGGVWGASFTRCVPLMLMLMLTPARLRDGRSDNVAVFPRGD